MLKANPKFLSTIMMLYITTDLLSGLMVYKVIQISSMVLPGGVVIFPIIYCLSNIVAEVYGYEASRKMIWSGLLCGFFFTLLSSLIIQLPSPEYWKNQQAFESIFGYMPRLFIAGLIGNICGQFTNVYIVSKLKILMNGKSYWVRSLVSNSVGELIYTLIAAPIIFLGVLPWTELLNLMLSVYFVKIIYTFLLTPLEAIAVYHLKKYEGIDVYDLNVNFTPFKFGLAQANPAQERLYAVK